MKKEGRIEQKRQRFFSTQIYTDQHRFQTKTEKDWVLYNYMRIYLYCFFYLWTICVSGCLIVENPCKVTDILLETLFITHCKSMGFGSILVAMSIVKSEMRYMDIGDYSYWQRIRVMQIGYIKSI